MLLSNRLLAKCEKLLRAGYKPALEQGMRVGRGFADLGYEEFCVLGGGKLCSLFTGAVVLAGGDFPEHFFHIPDCDELIALLCESGARVKELSFPEQRKWHLVLDWGKEHPALFAAATMHDLLLDACVFLMESGERV